MIGASLRRTNIFQVLNIVGFLVVLAIAAFDWWAPLTAGNATSERFQDLRQITATAQCLNIDPSRDVYQATCDPYGRPFNYPSLLARVLAIFGLGSPDTEILGIALIGLFFIGTGAYAVLLGARTARWATAVIWFLAVLSPPTTLLLERGNIDALIFFLVGFAVILASRRHLVASGILLGLGTALKLFPAGGLAGIVNRHRPSAVIGFGITAAIGIALTIRDILDIGQSTPQPIGNAFGAGLLLMPIWNTLHLPAYGILPRLLGLVFFVLITAGWLLLIARSRHKALTSLRSLVQEAQVDPLIWAPLAIGGGVFLAAYVAGTNFDYRLVFLIPVVTAFLALHMNGVPGSLGLSLAFLAPLWLSYAMPDRIQQAMDAILLVQVPFLAAIIAFGVWKSASHSKGSSD